MPAKLSAQELYKECRPDTLGFQTTREVPPLEGTIGQERAIKALQFGLSLKSAGFNIFILGESGTGKLTSIRTFLKEIAQAQPTPPDWCYVYDFKNPDVPKAISLAPGQGRVFQSDITELIKLLKAEIPKVFESKEYERQRAKLVEEFQKKQRELFGSLEEEASEKGFAIKRTVSGLVIVPVKKTGEPLTEEEFEALEERTKKKVEEMGRALQERLDDVVRTVREAEKLLKELLGRLEREAALAAVGHFMEELKSKYRDNEKIQAYLEDMKEDILGHLEDFKAPQEEAPPIPFMKPPREPGVNRYQVNVLVDNSRTQGAPCVYESNPTYYNLFGRIEHKIQFGVAVTDYTMIKPGSLHKANGGYIIINALDLLRNIFAYDALKRAIRNGELKIEDVWEQYRLISTTTLKPEAIPLDVKVILIGNPFLYYLLYNLDEEYKELFKVKADFDVHMDRTEGNIRKYAAFVSLRCREEGLLHFDNTGVAQVVEYGSRLAGHQEKLSCRFSEIVDIIREAHYWAQQEGAKVVSAPHVERALKEKLYRHSRLEDRMRELMLEDTLIVETTGAKVGQINGLAVVDLGDYSFGKPSRITARTYTGKAGVVNIERETKLSGRIHEKAILIITNYMLSRYALKRPISLSASITFEQLYGLIEGDSASCAELYALLSSIAQVPIRQSLAVTGSMDQNGEVQPIGGVNEKIEGFFELCRQRGLDGTQGVIIPKRNVRNLMLRPEVRQAVREGRFHIWPIEHVDEGVELLMGMPAGELEPDGTYPEGTLNYLVARRLEEITQALKAKREEEEEQKKAPEEDS